MERMKQKMMSAAILYGREDLRLEDVAVPVAGPGEVVLRVGAALTCGTDLKVYRRGYHAMMLTPPILFGHEVAGTIVEIGVGVTRFSVGDRVVPMNSAPCGLCFFCDKGQPNLCEDLLFNNGAYAEFMRVPARIVEKNMLALPDELPFEYAALTEPLACVVRGLEESGVDSGKMAGATMVVIGAGPIGLMFIHAAGLAGVDVTAVVKREDQVETARRFGARRVVRCTAENVIQMVREAVPGGRGADIVIEAVAAPMTWEWAVGMVRRGGIVNFFGGPPSGTVIGLDTNRLHYGEITLKASFHHTPATCRSAFDLVRSGRFKCSEFITGTARLEQVPEVFQKMLVRGTGGMLDIKTAIYPGEAKETGLDAEVAA